MSRVGTSPRIAIGDQDLDRGDPSPLHVQVSEIIRDRIVTGLWPPNYQLHAEPRLADELGVSRGTVRRATKTLIDEGLLVQVHGKGTFVRPRKAETPIAQEMISLSEAFERDGVTLVTEVLEQGLVTASGPVRGFLELDENDIVLRLVRRRGDGDGWIALFENYVRRDRCPGIETADFEARKLFDVIETDHGVSLKAARRSFQAVAADQRVADAIDCPRGAPVLHLEQVTYLDDAEPIEYSDVWMLGESLRLSSYLRRL